MEKMKFEKLSQFISALEEGSLYDENGVKYVLEKIPKKVNVLAIVGCSLKNRCVSCSASLLGAQEIGLTHTFTRKPLPKDKDLVWCYGGDMVVRQIHFYDEKNKGVFDCFGKRDFGRKYTNYEVIKPNSEGIYEYPFDWANEAKKKLED